MKKLFFGSLVTVLVLFGCEQRYSFVSTKQASSEHMSSQVVVKFQEGTEAKDIRATLNEFNTFEVVDSEKLLYLVKDKKFSGKEVASAEKINKLKHVEFAEVNGIIELASYKGIPRDTYWLRLWGLKNYGQDSPHGIEGKRGADIGAMKAWETTKGSREIRVAVMDTGIDYKHPDLKENIWVNLKEKNGTPGVDDDGNGYVDDLHGFDFVSDHRDKPHYGVIGDPDPMDDNSHGTHVAGTIGAVGDNGEGIVGVNWEVSLVGVKIFNAQGRSSIMDTYRAFKYIGDNAFDVANGSFGGGNPSKAMKMAIADAEKKGVLFVFAAGNDSANNDFEPSYPASYDIPNIISVAATDSRGRLASFSNFGKESVDIAAPGEAILSTIPLAGVESGGVPYAIYSGTSMAAPHVAGAAALLLAAEPSLRGKPGEIKARLMNSVVPSATLGAVVASGGSLAIDRSIADVQSGDLAPKNWKTMNVDVRTPAFSTSIVNKHWTIEAPKGATAMRVHIARAQIESGFDQANLFDGSFKKLMPLSGMSYDVWSPVVQGNKIYLQFSNALVSINNGTPFANFNSEGVIIDKIEYLD